MTLFYSGTLQEGIALAVQEAKAVVCFARGWLSIPPHHEIDRLGPGTAWLIDLNTDDTELGSTWEDDYFSDPEVYESLSIPSSMW